MGGKRFPIKALPRAVAVAVQSGRPDSSCSLEDAGPRPSPAVLNCKAKALWLWTTVFNWFLRFWGLASSWHSVLAPAGYCFSLRGNLQLIQLLL